MASTTGGDGSGRNEYDQGYGAPYGQPQARRNGAGIAALILGILSILFFWLLGLGLVPGVIGLILAIVGLRRVRRGSATNRGSALVGLITSIIGIVLSLVVVVALAVAWNNGGRDLTACVRDAGSSEAAAQQCVDTFTQGRDGVDTVNP